ncbi:SDR family oxidoreductase [Asinibacterium sp. OR53]|uniref:SDR family oxidoreductase n=1 Tax=Asinibacterium sp. OR53 TaxID=925409 RepID=UPI0004B40AED|nr:SDR family oxidoreductase [Asinibacterium sp. OR53]
MDNYLNKLFNFSGKSVLVTGACGQLGKEICLAFVNVGCMVFGVDVKTTQNNLPTVKYYEADISNQEQVDQIFSDIYEKYGKIDILINNAGVSTFEPFEERTEAKIDWVMNVNLKGTFWCIQSFVNKFDKIFQKAAVIVNIGSFYGVISPDFRIYTDCDRKNSEIYGATKAGVIQMSKYFAVHLADRNIRVNTLSPGGIFNPAAPQGTGFLNNYAFRCPMKRMANVEEMIGGILYLSSDASSYTTGQNLIIDGGMSSW